MRDPADGRGYRRPRAASRSASESAKLKTPASNAPEMECHTQDTAEAIAASGIAGKCFTANTVASPAFCMPTSTATVRRCGFANLAAVPLTYPSM